MSERAYGRLLDRCEQLEAEIERLQTDYTVLKIDYDTQRAEIEQLKRHIDTLEGMLGEANIAVPESDRWKP